MNDIELKILAMEAETKKAMAPVHVVEVAKAKKVMKVYSIIGKTLLVIFSLAMVAAVLCILWWVFAENLTALFIILGITGAAFALHLAASYYNYHFDIIEKAKRNGTIDD